MERYQNNINEPYLNFSKNLKLEYLVNPLIFYHNYLDIKYYDTGKKLLVPKSFLNDISKFDDIEFPIYISINNTIFTIYEFCDDINCIYIPTLYFYNLDLVESSIIPITILKTVPPKATYIKIKIWSKEFYNIPDIKEYLENNLKNMFAILGKKEYIKLPYYGDYIGLTITDTKPENIVCINEIEELEIDFEPINEKSTKSNNKDTEKIKDTTIVKLNNVTYYKPSTVNKTEKTNTTTFKNKKFKMKFTPFSGKGNSLKD